MKIFYAVQATGNGHISRAMELLPYLKQYGKVDIFLSGANSTLSLDGPVKYRSKGLSLFYTCNGSLDYSKIVSNIAPWRIMKEVRELPVEKYDLVINDFDCITSLACSKKKIPSVNFGHQASFLSPNTPRPEKPSRVGEWILKNYARATHHIGLHFESYDDFIYSPVVKEEILKATPSDKGHITVYLPSYCDQQLKNTFSRFSQHRFEIFSHQKKEITFEGNIRWLPVDRNQFNRSLITCHGIITGGGFETPAEALYLQKKIISIPIQGQYEQQCNGAALARLGVPVLSRITDDFDDHFNGWIEQKQAPRVTYAHSTEDIIQKLMTRCSNLRFELDFTYPDLIFN